MADGTPLQDSVMAAHGYYGRHAQPQVQAASSGHRRAGLRDRIAADPESATCRWRVMSLRIRRRARRPPGNPAGR